MNLLPKYLPLATWLAPNFSASSRPSPSCVAVITSFALCLLLPAAPAVGGVIGNGDFSDTTGDPSQAFEFWDTTAGSAPQPGLNGKNSFARFQVTDPSGLQFETDFLSQTLTLPPSAQRLSFDFLLETVANGSGAGGFVIPDAFGASLFNSLGEPLFASSPFFFDFFSVENPLSPGAPNEFFDPTVVHTFDLPTGWRRVELDLTSLSAGSPQALTLEFALIEGNDGFDTSVALDNVQIIQNQVPEPASIACWALVGVSGLRLRKRNQRGRSSDRQASAGRWAATRRPA